MSTSTRRNLAFALGLSAVVAMSGFLLNAAPPQAVGTWEVLGTTDPSSARSGAAIATLEDDTTLIAGGRMLDGTVTDSVLVYDPTTNASTVVGQLASPRVNAAAARLDDGRVLIVGGEIADLLSADAEIFNPATGTSIVVANMAAPRTRHAATRLADGKVLIVGGMTLENVTLATAEVFDPETGSILEVGSMATPRAGASATLLIDNRVLVAGGHDGTQDLASAELFYPATQEFFPVDTPLSQARAGHTAVLLPHNGAVLIAGGTGARAPVTTTDLFLPTMFPDPYTWSMGTFGPAEHLTHARNQAVSGPMGDDGYAFVAGGGAAEGEAYAFVTIKTDKDDYEPGEFALITGTGWQPGEEVELVFQEDPAVHPDYTLTLTANGDGEIYHDDWAPEEHDLNVRFYLMATGAQSHRRAQMTFTDARNLSLTFAGGGSGSVTLTPSTGTVNAPTSCGGTGAAAASQTVTGTCSPNITTSDNGATVTFTATAAGSSVFAGWSLPNNFNSSTCSGTTSPCSATLGSNPAITVTFNLNANTTTTVASSLNASTYGNNVTFTASVKVGATAVTAGSVTFIEGGTCALPATTLAGPVALNVSGQGAFSTATLAVPSHTITACYGGAAGFNSSNGNVTQTVNKANAVVVVAPYTVTYDGLPHSATVVSITGVLGQTGATVGTVDLANTTHTNFGIYNTDSWTFTGTSNYNNITATTITDTISKANAGVVVTPYAVTYDGLPHTATASITGVNGETGATVGTVNLTNTTHTSAGIYSTDSWSFTGTANYNNIAETTITDTINKADAVVVVAPYTVTYDGLPHTATVVSIAGVNSETGATVGTVDVTNTTHTAASIYAADFWTFTGTANYNNIAATTITDTINKANAVVVVTPYTVTYDGAPHTATVTSITGVNGETGATVGTVDVSNTTHTNAGIYSTDSWSFTGTANYNNIAATTITDTINKANAVVVVTPYTVTYDALPHTATVTSITGVAGQTGATVGTVDVSNTTHTDAGTYAADFWSFTGTANYNNIAATTITDTINKADATVVVTPYTMTYDALPHTATVMSITGVAGQTGATVGTVDVSNTTHTDAGVYNTDFWTFTGTANYNDIAATTITDTINKANAVVVVAPYTVTYDALPHSASVTSITGVAGQTGATVGTVDVSNTTHTDAGVYNTDFWTFTGTANYNDIAATTITDTINKANAVVVVAPYTVTYDALPHSASVTSITGVAGQMGATVGTVDVSNTTHTDAGVYNTDFWTFTGTANYNNIAATTITDTINKANAVVVVAPYTVTYDGDPHSAAVTSITGVAGQMGATVGTVDVSNTTHTDAGVYNTDFWTFTGTANYNDIAATTITDTINKANAVVVVAPYTVTYDALPHSASVTSITGVAGQTGVTVGTVDVSNTTHTDAGIYNTDFWTFTGTANYNDIAATTITDTINKANAVVVVAPYTVTYDALPHSASVTSITGVAGQTGVTVGTVDVSNTTHTDAGVYNTDFWTFTGTANYNNIAATTITDTINKANAVVVVAPYTVTYDALPHSAAVTSITGVNGETGATVGTVDVSNTTHTNAGVYSTDSWSFTGTANYNNIAATTITDTINQAPSTTTVIGGTFAFDGLPHAATAMVSGVGTGITQTAVITYSGSCSAAPITVAHGTSCTATGNYGGDANHLPSSGMATVTITPRSTTTTLSSSLDLSVTPVKVALTATVAGVPAGVPIPTGTVTFTDSLNGGAATPLGPAAPLNGSGVATLTIAPLGVGRHVVTATYNPTANFGGSASAANSAPEAAITGPATGSINPINVAFNFTGTFTDAAPLSASNPTAAWSFDGTSNIAGSVSGSAAAGAVANSKAFAAPGVYSVVLTVNDNLGGISIVDSNGGLKEMVIAYDANGGFVTGGGWINSPAGAYVADASLVGKANYGFVSKYKKGASIPEGETEFQFHAAGLNFKSTSYQWLVVQGSSKAQYKGTGTINGGGAYQFLVSVIDGTPDKIRVKITNVSVTVYDNMIGGGIDDADPPTAVGGGSIVIHTK